MYSKEERQQYLKNYKEKNPEKFKQQQIKASEKWRENNPEKYKQQNLYAQKKYYERIKNDEEFKEKRRQYAREYRQKHREEKIQYLREYRQTITTNTNTNPKIKKEKVVKKREPVVICKGAITISFN